MNIKLKISLSTILFLLTISLVAQTPGTLTFSFTPISHSGYSGTKNVLAVWIQTSTGTFVKTKLRYVGTGTDDHLPTWGGNAGCANATQVAATTGCNVTDATTGATLSSFTAKSITWDGKNVVGTTNGTTVADGTYRVAIEETWNHGAGGTVVRYFTFTKGPNIDHQTPVADGNFSNITLDWVPTALDVEELSSDPLVSIFPNPTEGILNINFLKEVSQIKIYNLIGQQIYDETINQEVDSVKSLDLTNFENGVYFMNVSNEMGTFSSHKIILNK